MQTKLFQNKRNFLKTEVLTVLENKTRKGELVNVTFSKKKNIYIERDRGVTLGGGAYCRYFMI